MSQPAIHFDFTTDTYSRWCQARITRLVSLFIIKMHQICKTLTDYPSRTLLYTCDNIYWVLWVRNIWKIHHVNELYWHFWRGWSFSRGGEYYQQTTRTEFNSCLILYRALRSMLYKIMQLKVIVLIWMTCERCILWLCVHVGMQH